MPSSEYWNILFVCLGNICRSPLAEAIVRQMARRQHLDGRYRFASAGTGDWHVGRGADPRSVETAARYGLDLSSHRARQITGKDIADWHWFVAMDRSNRQDLLDMGAPEERVLLMRQFEGVHLDVPDPYYGGPEGFDRVYHMLLQNAEALLDYLEALRGSPG